MVVVQQAEAAPLLPGRPGAQPKFRALLAAVGACALCALVAFTFHASSTPVAMLGDGVVPQEQLSFTRAEKFHNSERKHLGDVQARLAMNSYFDVLAKKESQEHNKAIYGVKKGAPASVMNKYFDKLGAKYAKETSHEKEQRKLLHPGMLNVHKTEAQRQMQKDEEIIMEKVMEDKDAPKDAKNDKIVLPKPQKAATQIKADNGKVKVGFYMESMCPGCKYYTTHVLKDLMDKQEFRQMVDFELVPYGNGNLQGSTVLCQHGPDECYGNQLLACMQSLYPVTDASTGFVPAFVCMEGKDGKPKDEAKGCAEQNGLDYGKIQSCADSQDGQKLALAAAKETEGLSPPHEYAPWITMNAKPLKEKAYDLQSQVCKAYKGSKPAMCDVSELKTAKQSLHDIGFPICPKEVGVV